MAVAAGPGEVLAEVDSRPMADLLRFAVQRSDNPLTDGLFLLVGRERAGLGTWARAEQAVRAALDELGVDHRPLRMADGSGLSRDDRLAPRLLVDLDRAMWSGPHAETWASLQAVAGESGTLRQRLRGTPAAGRLFGKTGTLNDVTALNGAVVGDAGDRYHFAVIGNDAAGAGRWPVRAFMDELVLLLAADVQDCVVRQPPPPEDEEVEDGDAGRAVEAGPLGRPPATVVCP
jgi:D-alanyl-D-alanine carboxypeptidase/D-alanyl-D-alanine-endopeptidase (penicillin-binding protein 4)